MDAITVLSRKRLAAMAAGEKVGSDAIAKSLRCYETQVHPILKERLCVWWDDVDRRSYTQGRTFTYDRNVAGMTGSNFLNFVFQSFYDQEPDEEVSVIYPKISRKTRVVESTTRKNDMHSEVVEWLKHSYSPDDNEVIALRLMATRELGSTIVNDLLDNASHSSLTQGVRDLLFHNSFHFPSNKFVTVENRILHQDLRMTVKYYPNRDDNRAYCSDQSRLRSLVASCLNRMISPKSMAIRRKLHSSRILRPDKKDVLDLHMPHARDEELGTYLLITDISNFTGSLANAWLMTYVMGLEVAQGKLEDRYQLFSVGEQFLKAKWSELLLLYVYLTVGVPCWIEEQSKFGYLSGGFLGTGGNITIGLLFLAVALQDKLWRLRSEGLDCNAQAGGDDVAFLIRCNRSCSDETLDDIVEELETYVGKVKEYSVVCLEDQEDGVIEDTSFCRKRIILSRDSACIHLTGEPSVPLPESLFPSPTQVRKDLALRAWRDLDNSLCRFDKQVPGCDVLLDTLRQLFLEHHRNVYPIRTHTTKRLGSSYQVAKYGETLITALGHKVVCAIRHVKYEGITALISYQSKVHHALCTDQLSIALVDMGEDSLSQVVMTKNEVHLLSRTTWSERICIDYDEELLVELINIVTK